MRKVKKAKAKVSGEKSNAMSPHIAKIYFCGADFVTLELPDSFNKTSASEKFEVFDSALHQFEKSHLVGAECNWEESSSLPMDVDIEGNFIGFMFCEKHFAREKEKLSSAMQNYLINEDEQNKLQMKNGMKIFLLLIMIL